MEDVLADDVELVLGDEVLLLVLCLKDEPDEELVDDCCEMVLWNLVSASAFIVGDDKLTSFTSVFGWVSLSLSLSVFL